MIIKIKKLCPTAKLPSYAKDGDAGMDLTCTAFTIAENYIEYHTGLAFEIPEGFVGLLFPRSSISKYNLSLCNAVGVLDSGYRGEVTFRFKIIEHNTPSGRSHDTKVYSIGDKIGQLIVLPYPKVELQLVDELSSTERGAGCYGSSDK